MNYQTLAIVLGCLLTMSETLPQTQKIQANSNYQLLINIVKTIISFLNGKTA